MRGQSALPDEISMDVVIPVYGNYPIVRRCLESVLVSRTAVVARVLVIDDASPDRETSSYLRMLNTRGAIDLIRHDTNQGFVVSANAGLCGSRRDVLLLNSDTEVHGNWAQRLMRCGYSSHDIGTVTPFSNNATICSYPFVAGRRGLPRGIGLSQLDGLFADANAGQTADLPTGVGFCLFIRRACLDVVGVFDPIRFGRGYGEETDFCQRARLAGWRNVICADTFVYHEAGATFGAEGRQRAREAERLLLELYPDYAKRVRDFIRTDSLARFRRTVDAARAKLSVRHAIAVLEERALEKAYLLAISVKKPASTGRPLK